MVQLAARASHDSAVLLLLPSCDTICSPGARALHASGSVPESHGPYFVVSAFRDTAATSAVFLSRGTEDCPWHLPRWRSLSERAKLTGLGCGAPCSREGVASCGQTADNRGSPPSQLAGHLSIFLLCHVIEAIIPANLQTEHFVNLHREQIQQSRVTPFKKGSETLPCPPLPSHWYNFSVLDICSERSKKHRCA